MAQAPVAVITGASAGIGASTARALRRAGYDLVLGARRLSRLRDLQQELERQPGSGRISIYELDVRTPDAIKSFAESVAAASGAVDVLVNNAGLAAGLATVAEGQDDDWRAMIETNVYGLLAVTRAFLPAMVARSRGHVVNVGSIAGFSTYPKGAVYAGTKHAVRAISGALRQELLGTGIRVSEVDPGMVETEFSLVRFAQDQERAKAVYQGMTPLTPDDVADAIAYCVTRPAHVNVDHIILMPTDQAALHLVHRQIT